LIAFNKNKDQFLYFAKIYRQQGFSKPSAGKNSSTIEKS